MFSARTRSVFRRRQVLRFTAISATLAAAFASPAAAFEIPIENPDLVMRWDNTFRYNLAKRVQSQDSAILGNPNNDDGDRNFKDGALVQNRLDLLSEFDFIWKRSYGFRVSGAFWRDWAYDSLDNTSVQTENTLVSGRPAIALSPYTSRYAKGGSGELLDAFAFANFDAGDIPVSVRVGQHAVFWGDSLLANGAIHSVSYGQYSLDLWKALATPGTEAKEIFRPRNGVTLQVQPDPTLSLAGQYFFDWEAVRFPESGSYLMPLDSLNFGADSVITGANPFAPFFPGSPTLARVWRTTDVKPRNSGDWGISARWSPEWLDGTLGFYYRNTSDIVPQVVVTQGVVPLSAQLTAGACGGIGGQVVLGAACIVNPRATSAASLTQNGQVGLYNGAYGTDINIYGVSLSKNIAGISFGSELSYRTNMPLQSDPVIVLPAPLAAVTPGAIATTAVPNYATPGALGNTWHGLLNGIYIVPKTALFDTATVQAELTWNNWASVTQNEAVFRGRSNYNQIDKVSKNFFGLAINFTPTWFQVFPGVDFLMPLSWAQGISGNSAVAAGGSRGAGNYAIGVAADIYTKYRIDLRYVGFYGDYSTNPNGSVNVGNGLSSLLSDRGFVALTFKATF